MKTIPLTKAITEITPAIRAILTQSGLSPIINSVNSDFLKAYEKNQKKFKETADNIPSIFIDENEPVKIIQSFSDQHAINQFSSGLIYIKGKGLLGVGLSIEESNLYLNQFLKGKTQVISEDTVKEGRVKNKIFIVTGGAQGFGKGIVDEIVDEGGYAVIADLNREAGESVVAEINGRIGKQRAIFIETDVTDPDSVKNLVFETVKEYGGLDVLISNAGVLKAGSIEEFDESTFDFVTRVNYTGFFICTKHCTPVMKLQYSYNSSMFMDIIQINSKSGLTGSNRNFAYAGSKFGSIGLVQSFALELVTSHIKVNAICPGNYFEGPLWSDPQNGLFAQYLKAGKVPGAKNINDVRKFYEAKVPMGRGCTPKDVVKTVYYLIEQEYETGQAVPVTGGQIMLN